MKTYKLFLKGGREYDLTYDQTIMLAKYIMHMPEWKKIKLHGVVFAIEDIDLDAVREYLKPQLKLIDIAPVEKKRKRNME